MCDFKRVYICNTGLNIKLFQFIQFIFLFLLYFPMIFTRLVAYDMLIHISGFRICVRADCFVCIGGGSKFGKGCVGTQTCIDRIHGILANIYSRLLVQRRMHRQCASMYSLTRWRPAAAFWSKYTKSVMIWHHSV